MSSGTTEQPTTADLLTRQLVKQGIDTLFALPGVQNDHLFDAFARAGNALNIIHTRHEQGAAYMAMGAAMATGKPAVYSVVPGPGILNATAAISTAYACNAPIVGITGQIPSKLIGKGFGILHEIPDQLVTLRSLNKWAERIDEPEQAEALVSEAISQSAKGRPGPVTLESPLDIWPKRLESATCDPIKANDPIQLAEQSLADEAAELIIRAKKPVIVVGAGAQHASSEIRELAELLGAPVLAHRMGQGIMDSRHYLAANIVAGAELWATADLVIGIGTRLQMQQMGWGVDDKLKIVRIEIDPIEMSRFKQPDVGLLGDSKLESERLVSLLKGRVTPESGRRQEIEAVQQQAAEEIAYLEPQLSYLKAIRDALPEEGIFVDELTQIGYVSRLAFPVYQPHTFLSPGYQGTLGWGLPTALGAKAACPDKPVVMVSGDGGFMFNVQELATAVQYKLPVAIVLFNDGAFGNVKRTQEEDFDGRFIASKLQNPDFIKLAEAYGAEAIRVDGPEQLGPAITQAFSKELPTLIEVPVKPMPSPWKFLRPVRKR